MSKPEATVAGKNALKPNSKENFVADSKIINYYGGQKYRKKKTNEAQAAEWFQKLINQLL